VSVFTVVVAIIANLIVRAVAFALLPLSAEFPPLRVSAVALFTFGGVVAAAGVYALVRRFTRRAVLIYSVVALIALLVSLIPDFQMLGDPAKEPFPGVTDSWPGATVSAIWVMMAFHVVAAVVSVGMLTQLAPPPQERA